MYRQFMASWSIYHGADDSWSQVAAGIWIGKSESVELRLWSVVVVSVQVPTAYGTADNRDRQRLGVAGDIAKAAGLLSDIWNVKKEWNTKKGYVEAILRRI
jgi:hypothetical protein